MNADTEQAAWDDWNKWGATVTATPMIREAHRAAYRRALQDAADNIPPSIALGMFSIERSGIRKWLRNMAAAVGVTGDTTNMRIRSASIVPEQDAFSPDCRIELTGDTGGNDE
jgi:hypothetical protein